jgi:hypothetical protein
MDTVERTTHVGIGVEPAQVGGRLVASLAVAIAGVVLLAALFATTLAGGGSNSRAMDTSYDRIETMRGAHGLVAAPAPWADDSYDRIESQRGRFSSDGDRSYDDIERLRGAGSGH